MEKVLLWFQNHIQQLKSAGASAEEIKTALEMQFIVSESIDWDSDEEEPFCHECDWHGSCQAHPKE
jgi:hypothetical protein